MYRYCKSKNKTFLQVLCGKLEQEGAQAELIGGLEGGDAAAQKWQKVHEVFMRLSEYSGEKRKAEKARRATTTNQQHA